MKKSIRQLLLAGSAVLGALHGGPTLAGGSDPFIGQIMWVPYNFEPRGWAFCNGQLLSISQNSALFPLLGITYGGDGQETFGLPNMQGRLMVHAGQGAGLGNYTQGQRGGAATHTLTNTEMPSHTHAVNVSTAAATAGAPTGNNQVQAQAAHGHLYSNSPATTVAATATVATGGGQAHSNMMPYTTLNCIIATEGIFPSRN